MRNSSSWGRESWSHASYVDCLLARSGSGNNTVHQVYDMCELNYGLYILFSSYILWLFDIYGCLPFDTLVISCCGHHTHSLIPRHYNPCRVLADSRSRLQPSLSLALLFQFLTPSLSASLITPSIHLRFGLPTCLLPSGLSKVIFLCGNIFFLQP